MNTRNYRLIAVNERTGNKTTLSDDALTHDQACTMKGKFSQHKERRIELEEVNIMASNSLERFKADYASIRPTLPTKPALRDTIEGREIWLKGFECAGRSNACEFDNPYPDNSEAAIEWQRGFDNKFDLLYPLPDEED